MNTDKKYTYKFNWYWWIGFVLAIISLLIHPEIMQGGTLGEYILYYFFVTYCWPFIVGYILLKKFW
jgi:hypothetical protein